MTNRQALIRDGITDAYAEYSGLPWAEAKHAMWGMVRYAAPLEQQIDGTLPKRWNSLVAARLRTCAKAYALAEMESDPLTYRKDGLL